MPNPEEAIMYLTELRWDEALHEACVLSGEYYSDIDEQDTSSSVDEDYEEENYFELWENRQDEIDESFIQNKLFIKTLKSAAGYIEQEQLNDETETMQELDPLPPTTTKYSGYEPDPIPLEPENEEGEQDYQIQLRDAINKQAAPILDEYSLNDLMPPSAARFIEASSKRSQTDPIALAMHLNAAVGGLLGSKVKVDTLFGGGIAFPSNLYVWFVGDTSTGKTKIAQKIMEPLQAIASKDKADEKRKLDSINQEDIDALKKKEKIQNIKTNQRREYTDGHDMTEQALNKLLSHQARHQGLHIHLDEGSNLFDGVDRYSGNRNTSGTAKRSLLRTVLLIGWDKPLRGSSLKVDEDRCIHFDNQSLSLTLNIQQQFLPEMLDMKEDSDGQAARHDVILLKRSTDTMTRESRETDGMHIFMKDRVIPFCKSIIPKAETVLDDISNEAQFITCFFSPEAQELYEEYKFKMEQLAISNIEQDIEPAYHRYIYKVGIRLGKLALIQHVLECLENARRDGTGYELDIRTTFTTATSRVDKPISRDAMQRAINWCNELCKQRQWVNDATQAAPMKREAALRLGTRQRKMSHVLSKLESKCIESGSQNLNTFIANTKGTQNMERAEIKEIIQALHNSGCLEITTRGKTKLVDYIKPLRQAIN